MAQKTKQSVWMKMLLSLLFFLVTIYIAIASLLYFKQRDFIYYPAPSIAHKYSEMSIPHQGETIKVISLNSTKPQAILYFGGNAESVEYNIDDFYHYFPNYSIYLVKYRGYGGSTGKPSETALYSDALYIFDKIKQKHNAITVIGRSLGSGVASFVASKRELDKLILITPFDSILSVAQERFPIYPLSLMLKDKYDSLSRVKAIKAKVLMLIAENDQVISATHSNRLYRAFPSTQVSKIIIENTNHNNIATNKMYYQSIRKFLKND